MRSEQEIFSDLAKLCVSPGYIHAISYFCFRDNMVGYSGELTPDDLQHTYSATRLIRTEVSTLIGLMIKTPIDFTLPPPNVAKEQIEKTEALLDELHKAMSAVFFAGLTPEKIKDPAFNPFTSGDALREPIFYGGESAYSFQYRDFAPSKYAKDDVWLKANKGFSITELRSVVCAVGELLDRRVLKALRALKDLPPDKWTMLPGFSFTAEEIATHAHLSIENTEMILNAFALSEGERNVGFRALHDFNIANATPLIRAGNNQYILFQIYSLVEALYDAPFYWMGADKTYAAKALQHRGEFTEEFSAKRLAIVFGKERVFPNVTIIESKGKPLGEIDTLVVFGHCAVVLQAKSKKLTLEARKGNDGQIRDDFKKSIQNSYDQAYACAELLVGASHKLIDRLGNEITFPFKLKHVYIFCVVSDHYPALSFQARQFLKYTTTAVIHPPFIMDIFALDAMTEMLQSPLQLLSYVDRRTNYSNKLHASHELTILAYHLKQNLWLDDKHDFVTLMDDLSADLDAAMIVRREGLPGKTVPEGILTRFSRTAIGRLVARIEARPDPATLDLGFMLLTLGEDTVLQLSKWIEKITKQAVRDSRTHDVTIGVNGGTGLTIHCNNDPLFIAEPRLRAHCMARKYTEKAATWFGVCIHPTDQSPRFGINLVYPWEQSADMDAATKRMPRPSKSGAKEKVGRNDLCPCGSGRKYKRCCLGK